MQTVDIYTSPLCGFCHAAKRLLTQKGVSGKEPRTRRFQVSGLRGDAGQNNQFLMVEARAEQVSGKFHALNRQLHIANKRVEMQRRTLDELSSSYEELDRFSAFAAHDLQAPLRGISNWLRFLREDFADLLPPDGVECLEMAEGSANRLGALISSLLTLSRSDRAEMHRTEVSLPTLIDEVTATLAADIADTGARVIREAGLGTLRADRDLLLLLLQNLIGNALRYRSPDRAPVVRITRTPTEDGGEEIAVIDNGRGFENGYAEQILKPFQRLYSASEIPGSGIGLAIARALAAEGASVVLNGFGDDSEIAKLCDELGATHSGADLTDVSQIEAMMEEAGGVDVLVNNAGMQHVAPVEDFPVEKWDTIIALNLTAAFHTTRLAIPGMKAKGWGRIINTASAHSKVASPFKSAYISAKHGLDGLTKTVALEVAEHGVTANCISPGYVWTPLVENQIPDTMKARGMTREEVINDVLLVKQATKKFVQPEEIGALAAFLCRDEAQNVNGANWSVDGGWTAE